MRSKKFGISVPFLAVIAIAAFLRLFTLKKLMVFTPDEEYVLFITKTLVNDFHIIWVGVSALGFDFYMGPGLNYFLVPFMMIFKGDPLAWGVITSLFGVMTTILIYWFGKKIFNFKTGFIASLVYASSALLVYYDQQPYPTGVPLLSMIMFISIYMTKFSKKWWIVFSFFYGLVFHIHLSLVLVIFVALYWALTHRKTWNLRTLIGSVAVFVLVISPLIGFDYFHKLSNVTAPIRVLEVLGKGKNKLDLVNRGEVLAKSVSRIWYLDIGKSNTDEVLYPCNSLPKNNSTMVKWSIVFVIFVLLFVFFKKKDTWNDEKKRLLILYSMAFLLPFILLSSVGSVEYYLLGFFPIFILIVSFVITSLPRRFKYLMFLLIFVFVLYNSITVLRANGAYGLRTKHEIVDRVMTIVGNSSYSLSESGGPCQGTAGWGYLFTVYGRSPENNIVDKQFAWLLPIGSLSKTKYSVVINESRFPGDYKGYKTSFNIGGFTTYIFQN